MAVRSDWEEPTISLKADEAQPLWLEIGIPRDSKAGEYEARLVVQTGEQPIKLAVSLRVWDFEMPAERHLGVINWWRFPGFGFEKSVAPHKPGVLRAPGPILPIPGGPSPNRRERRNRGLGCATCDEAAKIVPVSEENMKNALPICVPIEVAIGCRPNWLAAHD